MKRFFLFFSVLLLSAAVSAGVKLPKKVASARGSVVSVLTYTSGMLKGNGTAVFVSGGGNLIVPYSLMYGADSVVVIDSKGKARSVQGIVGLDEMYDCVRVRVAADKKISHLPVSSAPVSVGDELYMLSYGKKNSGEVHRVKVSAVDSLYSHAYYTLNVGIREGYEGLPLVNDKGEMVALMQPSSTGDTCSYAIGATIYDNLVATSATYGLGYYSGMGLRTLLPEEKEAALSCMYMRAMFGDKSTFVNVVDDFIAAFPTSYEGYVSKAEYLAEHCHDFEAAGKEWDRALSLTDKPAEVYFSKAKTIRSIVMDDSAPSHPMLSNENVLSLLDKAIAADSLPLCLQYKADWLYEKGRYPEAYDCYASLVGTDLAQDGVYANASQCQYVMKNYDVAIELMDSAVKHSDSGEPEYAAPLLFRRGLMKDSIGRYRDAVMDYNLYEETTTYSLGSTFYYIRSQAETKCKMYQQALNDLEKAISIAPDYILYYFEKGVLCYRLNLLEEAAGALEQAKKLDDSIADVYYLLGCVYSKTGNRGLAEENLVKARSMEHPDAANKLEELNR